MSRDDQIFAGTLASLRNEPAHALNVFEHIAIEAFKVRLAMEYRDRAVEMAIADAHALTAELARARLAS